MNINADKIAIFSDIHWGTHKDNQTNIEINEKFIDYLIKNLDKQSGIISVFFLGDWFENRTAVNTYTCNKAKDSLRKLCSKYNVYMIVGNHDIYLDDSVEINSLKRYDIDNLHIISETTEAKINGKKCLLCPWHSDIESYNSKHYNFLMGHFDMSGAALVGTVSKGLYSFSALTKMAPLVFSGHYHIRKEYDQKDGKVITVGSPLELTLEDKNNSKGFYILDIQSESYTFVKNDLSPKHVEFYLSKLKSKQQKLNKEAISNSYVKLIIDTDYKYDDVLKLQKAISTCNPVKLLSPKYLFNNATNILHSSTDTNNTSKILTKKQYAHKFIDDFDVDNSQSQFYNVSLNSIKNMFDSYYELLEDKVIQNSISNVEFKHLKVQNFKSIGPMLDFDFTKHKGLQYVYGENYDITDSRNGVGKTSLFVDSILFCLYGKLIKNTLNKNIPNRTLFSSKLDTVVQLDLKIDKDVYRIQSSIKPKASTVKCRVWKNGYDKKHEITKSSLAQTRKLITNELLKCNFELFKNSIILSSSNIKNFYTMEKKDKREYIESVFDLSIFGEMLISVRKDKNELNKLILSAENEVRLSKQNLEKYLEKSENFDKSIEDEKTEIEHSIKTNQDILKTLKTTYTEKEESIIENIKKIDVLKENISKLYSKKVKLNGDVKTINVKIDLNKNAIDKHDEILKLVCDECNRKVKTLYRIDDLQKQLDNLNETLNIVLKNIKTVESKESELQTKLNKFNIVKEKILKIQSQVEKNIWTKTQLENTIKGNKEKLSLIKKKENPFIDLINEANDNILTNNKQLEEQYKRLEVLSILELVLDENGVKKVIIKDLIDVLNNLILKYLEEIGAQYTAHFDESFECIFVTNTGECEYNNFSMGETQKLVISTLFAFKDILSSGGITSNIFVVDELLDKGICETALINVTNILKKQSDELDQTIYIISHRTELQNQGCFDNVIKLSKKDEITKIEYGS